MGHARLKITHIEITYTPNRSLTVTYITFTTNTVPDTQNYQLNCRHYSLSIQERIIPERIQHTFVPRHEAAYMFQAHTCRKA